jgi:hypothetical protein
MIVVCSRLPLHQRAPRPFLWLRRVDEVDPIGTTLRRSPGTRIRTKIDEANVLALPLSEIHDLDNVL